MRIKCSLTALLLALLLVRVWAFQPPAPGKPTVGAPAAASVAMAHIWAHTIGGGDCTDHPTPVVYNASTACNTLALAAATSDAGDVIRVKPGTYTESVTESTSGSSGSTITYVADGAVTLVGTFTLSGDYVRLIGFTIDANGNAAGIVINGRTGSEVWNNTVFNFDDTGINFTGPSSPYESNTATIAIGNTITGDYGGAIGQALMSVNGPDNLTAYNIMTTPGCDYIVFYGPRNRFTNNYATEPAEAPLGSCHSDFLQTGVCCSRTIGTEATTLEANFYVGNPPGSDQHFTNMETTPDFSGHYLVRRNVAYNNAGGTQGAFEYTSVYLAHELAAETVRSDAATSITWYIRNGTTVLLTNNLFYDAWGTSVTTATVYDADGAVSNFNMAWDISSGAGMAYGGHFTSTSSNEITTQQPLFVNYGARAFQPTSSSPARNAAGPLTTASGSGTGTTFNVATNGGGFFRGFNSTIAQYGGNLAAGDIITIGTDVRRIASISGDAITVTSPFTWANGDGVHYGDNAVDNAIGPFPYRASHTLTATYSCNGSTCTVVPSDAGLTRMVVCYADSVPYQVVIDAPYTCTDPSGAFEARVYPLYASTTLWAVATP